jgi:hypothetical protein
MRKKYLKGKRISENIVEASKINSVVVRGKCLITKRIDV